MTPGVITALLPLLLASSPGLVVTMTADLDAAVEAEGTVAMWTFLIEKHCGADVPLRTKVCRWLNASQMKAEQKRAQVFSASPPMTECENSAVHMLGLNRAASKLRALNRRLPADLPAANQNYQIARAMETSGAAALKQFRTQGCSIRLFRWAE